MGAKLEEESWSYRASERERKRFPARAFKCCSHISREEVALLLLPAYNSGAAACYVSIEEVYLLSRRETAGGKNNWGINKKTPFVNSDRERTNQEWKPIYDNGHVISHVYSVEASQAPLWPSILMTRAGNNKPLLGTEYSP